MSLDQLNSMSKLAQLVRKAEAKTKGGKIEQDLADAKDRRARAISNLRKAKTCFDQEASVLKSQIEECDKDRTNLERMVKDLAKFRKDLSAKEREQAEALVVSSKMEVDAKEEATRARYDEISKALAEARKEDKASRVAYEALVEQARRLDLDSELLTEESDQDVELALGLRGRLRYLSAEIDRVFPCYKDMPRELQHQQLAVWMGSLRHIQYLFETSLDPEDRPDQTDINEQRRLFHRLKDISSHYQPGHIPSFQQAWEPETDWNEYMRIEADRLKRCYAAIATRETAVPVR